VASIDRSDAPPDGWGSNPNLLSADLTPQPATPAASAGAAVGPQVMPGAWTEEGSGYMPPNVVWQAPSVSRSEPTSSVRPEDLIMQVEPTPPTGSPEVQVAPSQRPDAQVVAPSEATSQPAERKGQGLHTARTSVREVMHALWTSATTPSDIEAQVVVGPSYESDPRLAPRRSTNPSTDQSPIVMGPVTDSGEVDHLEKDQLAARVARSAPPDAKTSDPKRGRVARSRNAPPPAGKGSFDIDEEQRARTADVVVAKALGPVLRLMDDRRYGDEQPLGLRQVMPAVTKNIEVWVGGNVPEVVHGALEIGRRLEVEAVGAALKHLNDHKESALERTVPLADARPGRRVHVQNEALVDLGYEAANVGLGKVFGTSWSPETGERARAAAWQRTQMAARALDPDLQLSRLAGEGRFLVGAQEVVTAIEEQRQPGGVIRGEQHVVRTVRRGDEEGQTFEAALLVRGKENPPQDHVLVITPASITIPNGRGGNTEPRVYAQIGGMPLAARVADKLLAEMSPDHPKIDLRNTVMWLAEGVGTVDGVDNEGAIPKVLEVTDAADPDIIEVESSIVDPQPPQVDAAD
jgi:hypothetical protein